MHNILKLIAVMLAIPPAGAGAAAAVGRRRSLFSALAIVGLASQTPAAATTYDFSFVADAIAAPAFGLTSVPAGPFHASVTTPDPVGAHPFQQLPVSAASFEINGHVFSPGPDYTVRWSDSTDALGDVLLYDLQFIRTAVFQEVAEVTNAVSNVGWFAFDLSAPNAELCVFTPLPLSVSGVGCIAGSPDTVTVSTVPSTTVAEPGMTAVLAGIGAFVAFGRRRRAAEHI